MNIVGIHSWSTNTGNLLVIPKIRLPELQEHVPAPAFLSVQVLNSGTDHYFLWLAVMQVCYNVHTLKTLNNLYVTQCTMMTSATKVDGNMLLVIEKRYYWATCCMQHVAQKYLFSITQNYMYLFLITSNMFPIASSWKLLTYIGQTCFPKVA